MMRFLVLFLTGMACLAAAPGAKASLGDCNEGAYISSFGRDISHTGSFLCVERARIEISTPRGGERTLRIIHHAAFDWAAQPGAYEAAEQGLQAAADALPSLGDYDIQDVTILLLDDFPPEVLEDPHPDAGEIIAETGVHENECRIVFYLVGAGGDPENITNSVAHEIFHCVQNAMLDPWQIASSGGGTGSGGDWWIEGSAEWFGHFAVGNMGLLPGRIAEFDDQVNSNVALNEMDYGAVVFFLWLAGGDRGPSGVLPFLDRMADRPEAAAQHRAMRSALSADEWQDFVQEYLDGRIKHPAGLPLTFSIPAGASWVWDESREENIELEPFVITPGTISFECGAWRIQTRPDSANYGARPFVDGAWGPLPVEVDTEAGEEDIFRFGTISVENGTQEFTIDVERLRSCEPCGGTQEIDRCLAGVWEQSGGGAVEWMRRQLPSNVSIPVAEQASGAIILNEDGTYWTAPLSQHIVIVAEEHDGTTTADGTGEAMATGRWSAKDGQLNMCQDGGGLAGSAQVTAPETSFNMPFGSPGAGNISMRYTCSDTGFETQMDIPGSAAPMTTQYSKIGG